MQSLTETEAPVSMESPPLQNNTPVLVIQSLLVQSHSYNGSELMIIVSSVSYRRGGGGRGGGGGGDIPPQRSDLPPQESPK